MSVHRRLALAAGVLSASWTLFLLIVGGVDVSIFGLRVRSNDWTDAALVALVSFAAYAWLGRAPRATSTGAGGTSLEAARRWLRDPGNLLLLAILTAAAVARFWALTFGFPHPAARPDEEAVAALAGAYLRGNFLVTTFTYPPLFILVVAVTIWLVFFQLPSTLRRLNISVTPGDPSTAAERTTQRVLSAAAGVFSVWLIFRIGTRLFGRPAALAAAAFLAFGFLHVRDSHFGVTDIPMTCMVLAAFLAIVRLHASGSRRDLVSAGVITGLAVATKYNAALLVLPACFAILDDPLRRAAGIRLGRVVAFGALMTAAFLVVCPSALINHETFIADVLEVSRHLARGHGPDLGRGWVYHPTTTLRYGLGLPLLAAGVVGLLVMVSREGRRGVLVALFPVAYYVVSGSGRTVFARHALPLVPFLCLAAGYLVALVGAMASERLRRPRWRVPATTLLTALVVLPSVQSVVAFNRLIAREDSRVIARRWIEARFPPGTTILQLGQTNAHPYIYYEAGYVLSETPTTFRPALVILVSSPLASPDLDSIAPWVKREYELRFSEQVVAEDDPANTYDRQDEFYVPLAGFHQIERPGPNLRVYVRRDLSIAESRAIGR